MDFKERELDDEYCHCVFDACDFSGKTIRDTVFGKCVFRACNFSLTRFREALRGVACAECNMPGRTLQRSAGFQMFWSLNIRALMMLLQGPACGKPFSAGCNMREAYMDSADMADSVFDRCALERASFAGAHLERSDFSAAFNFSINPALCRLNKAVFSRYGLSGLVAHLNIEIRE